MWPRKHAANQMWTAVTFPETPCSFGAPLTLRAAAMSSVVVAACPADAGETKSMVLPQRRHAPTPDLKSPPRTEICERCQRAVGAAAHDAANLAVDSILPQFFVHCNTATPFFCLGLSRRLPRISSVSFATISAYVMHRQVTPSIEGIGGSTPVAWPSYSFVAKPVPGQPRDRSREAFAARLGSRFRGGHAALPKVCIP